MKGLSTAQGDAALRAVLHLRPILAFDFDGTLAPIVARPDDARVPDDVSARLATLAAHLPVAVITGRSVADVLPRLGFSPRDVIGNHGAEDPHAPSAPAVHAALEPLRRSVAAEATRLAAAGVQVEDKGLSLAFHYRRAPDPEAALGCIESLLREMGPSLTRFGGKCVVNVLAAGLPDKGEALAALVRRTDAAAAVFFGDDVNDETVFARAEPHWLTVRVGRDDPHSGAMFCIDSDADLGGVLSRMIALLELR